MAGYDRHTESVYGKFAATKITHALYSSRFCSICLGNSDKLHALDSSGAGDDEKDSNLRPHTWREMVEEVFGDAVIYILFSDHICSACTKSVQNAFTFIQQTKANAKIFTEYFNTLHKLTIELLQVNNAEDISKVLFNLSFNLNNVANHEKEHLNELKHTEEKKTELREEMEINETIEEDKQTRLENEAVLNSEEIKDKNKFECKSGITKEFKLTQETEGAGKTAEMNTPEKIQKVEKIAEINIRKESEEIEKTKEINGTEKKEVQISKEINMTKEIEVEKAGEINITEEIEESETIAEINVTDELEKSNKTEDINITKEIEKLEKIGITEEIKEAKKTDKINVTGETERAESTEEINIIEDIAVTEVSKKTSKYEYTYEIEMMEDITVKDELEDTEEIEKRTNEKETSEKTQFVSCIYSDVSFSKETELFKNAVIMEEIDLTEVIQEPEVTNKIETTEGKEVIKQQLKNKEIEITEKKTVPLETQTKKTDEKQNTQLIRHPEVLQIKEIIKQTEKTMETQVAKEKDLIDEIQVTKETEATNETEIIEQPNVHGEKYASEVTKEITIIENPELTDEIRVLKASEQKKTLEETKMMEVFEKTQITDQKKELIEVTKEKVLEETQKIKLVAATAEIDVLDNTKGIYETEAMEDEDVVEVLEKTEIIEEIEILDSDTEMTEESEEIDELEALAMAKIMDVFNKTELIEEIEILDSDTEITEETEILNVLKKTKLTEEIEVLQKTKETEVTAEKEVLEEMGEIELLEENFDSDTEINEETGVIEKDCLSEKIWGGKDLETNKENEVNNKTKTTELINDQKKCYECGTCNRIYWLKSWFSLHLKTKGHIAKTKVACPTCVNRPCKHEKYLLAYEQQKGNSRVECALCKDMFYNLNELIAHVNENHFRNKPFICDICNREFHIKTQLIAHLKKHNPKVKCSSCSRVFRSDVFKKHQSKCQVANEPVKCDKCPALFINIEAYLEHKKEHPELDIQDMALETPVNKDSKENGQITSVRDMKRTTKRKDYDCPICQYQCRARDQLSDHLKSMHPEKTKRTCPVCVKTFDSRQHYLDHRKTKEHLKLDHHTPTLKRLYCCDYCEYSTEIKGFLVAHINRLHLKIMPYECPICNEKFLDERHLNMHLNGHSSKEKQICNLCGKVLISSSMVKHMRRHTGEPPYHCQLCTKKFKRCSDRRLHVSRAHTGKTVACPLCDKMFHSTSYMRAHAKKHHWSLKGEIDFEQFEGVNHDSIIELFRDKRKVF